MVKTDEFKGKIYYVKMFGQIIKYKSTQLHVRGEILH